jgi:hypothetical protein
MREDLLYFIWKTNNSGFIGQSSTEGDVIEIINSGNINSDSGPDFFNAKVRIGDTVWVGNVEIHINSSDWFNHNHHTDSAFDNVILHVVVNDDKPAFNSKGRIIPTVRIKYPDVLEWNLMHLTSSGKWIPCEDSFSSFDPFAKKMLLDNLLVERLEQKTKYVFDLVDKAQGSWEEAFYQSIARSFGLRANALPFELLAKNTALKSLSKHKNNLFQIEAILFGQSGLIPNDKTIDNYTVALLKEYKYLQQKFALTPIQGHLWKFLRMRPTAFPTIRIAQFATLVNNSTSLFSKILEIDDCNKIIELFQVNTSEYWKTHFTFGKESKLSEKRIGKDTISIITINSLVPFIFAYGIYKSNNTLRDKAFKLLESIKPESNSITKGFEKLNLLAESACDSQAMIQLKTGYCDPKKCLYCQLGINLLLKSIE